MKFASNLATSLVLACLVLGCTSVIQKQAKSSQYSYDNGVQNSGFLGWATNNSTTYGVITTNCAARYIALITLYGNKELPALYPTNAGVINNGTNVYIPLQDLARFAKYQRWFKNLK